MSGAQLSLARRAWAALRSGSPELVQALVDGRDPALPYLAAALHRHLRDLPWSTDGLSLTERLCLAAVTGGARTLQLLPPLRTLTRRGLLAPAPGGWGLTGSEGTEIGVAPGWRWDPERGRVIRWKRSSTGWGVDGGPHRA